MNSNTPRTDAECHDDFMVNHDADPPELYVTSKFARQLERELATAKADCAAWNNSYHEANNERIRLRELADICRNALENL